MPLAADRRRGRYGHHHQTLRASLAPIVAAGQASCARCGLPIAPDEPWDLGHVTGSADDYSGPEHRRCNRATAGPPSRPLPHSRSW